MTNTSLHSRRKFLKQMVAAGLIHGTGALCFANQVEVKEDSDKSSLSHELSAANLTSFIQMSVVLTGYVKLQSSLAPEFVANIVDKKSLKGLLGEFDKLPLPRDVQQLNPILQANTAYMSVAKTIILLWYTGTILTSPEDNELYMIPAYKPTSSTAYLEGIAWGAIQAHPMGQCGDGEFGYWATPPPA